MAKTDLRHFAPKTQSFNGIYRGVIENNTDPEMLGRCKVRIFGVHTIDKNENEQEGIPTDKLPWAEPCLGLVEGSVSGNGMFSIPVQGSHVFLFFEGGNWECPRYFATVPGQPSEAPDKTKGFNDPNGQYPRSDRLGEPDWHRLARGNITETVVDWRNQNIDEKVPIAIPDESTESGQVEWDEPESAYAAQYPNNIVLSTHRGITIEIDSTEGEERIHIYHPSNSYMEIDSQGNLVFRNDGNRFEITRGNRSKHILNDDHETIDNDKTKYIKHDEIVKIDNDRTSLIGHNEEETIANDRLSTIGKDDTKSIGQNWSVSVGGNIDITAGGNITIKGARIDLNP